MSESWLLYNGQLRPAADFALPLPNRGLFYNDGFFETLIWSHNTIRYLPYHLARMQQAAAALHLTLPASLQTASALVATLGALVQAHNLPEARLRLQLWRAGAGLYTPETTETAFLATLRPFVAQSTPIGLADFSQRVRNSFSPVSFCKGPNALHYVLASQERQARQLDDLVLLTTQGHVAEGLSAALFWLQDGRLFTPALTAGCVAGVRRAHLLHVARLHGLPSEEGLFTPATVLGAEAVFLANVAAIRPIRQLAQVEFATEHPLLQALQRWEGPL